MLMAAVLAKAKEREDGQDDYNQSHQVNQPVHGFLLHVSDVQALRDKQPQRVMFREETVRFAFILQPRRVAIPIAAAQS
jgi:hypothetical protein